MTHSSVAGGKDFKSRASACFATPACQTYQPLIIHFHMLGAAQALLWLCFDGSQGSASQTRFAQPNLVLPQPPCPHAGELLLYLARASHIPKMVESITILLWGIVREKGAGLPIKRPNACSCLRQSPFGCLGRTGLSRGRNAPDQRPRNHDARHETGTLSQGSLHPVCPAMG
jgi:hypothetical protein